MPVKISPSTNIIRDVERQFNYIVTPNAKNTIQQIIADFNTGIHSNIIIGSYGSGKSSLLWAFEQTLKGKAKYFDVKGLNCKSDKVKFLRFVGEHDSIINSFSEQLNVKKISAGNQQIFDAIYQEYEPVKRDGLLLIAIDEFGKFLEYGAKHNAEKELYFIQQLAEFCNHPDRKILLITTLHQNFDAYALGLNESQRNEWTKVKGRLKEITFNEPIEQLLALAASYNNSNPDKETQNQLAGINNLVRKHHLFRISNEFIDSLGFKLYPIDFISGYCLIAALQRYGQNERSLFTFLESREYKQLKESGTRYASVAWLYDYLWSNFYTFLHTKNNPHYNMWMDVESGIQRAEAVIKENIEDAIVILKTIGLLNAFASKGASLNKDFLNNYLSNIGLIANSSKILDQLAKHKIIIYGAFNDSYRLFQGTDVDIDQALLNAEKEVDEIADVASFLNIHFGELPVITAKEVSYKTGTPRNFAFVVSEGPKKLKAEGEIDGYVNLIVNEKLDDKLLVEHSKKDTEANIYGLFKNSKKIKSILFDIEKALKVKSENLEDKVVLTEMDKQISSHKILLRHYFIDAIYTDDVVWYFKGKPETISNKRQFNQLLSKAIRKVYPSTPTFKNELVNRNKISSSIHIARKDFFFHLVNNWSQADLGYGENSPPDKTIYISLLRENGIHKKDKNSYSFSSPSGTSSFIEVWNACEEFLDSTKIEKKPISDLYDRLLSKPYKLKTGLAEFLIPVYLFIKRDDYALFGGEAYIPEVNETTLVLFARNADEYSIKAFDFEGVRIDLFNWYREFLNQDAQAVPNKKNFIESIKPFLVFYRQLNDYSKYTKGLSKEALAIRDAIATSKDPEKTFFEDFPKALRTSVKEIESSKEGLKEYAVKLKSCITEIRTSYDDLIARYEKFICKEIVGETIPFAEYKSHLQDRFQNIKEYLMLNHQRVFHQRVCSPLDDRKSWLSSVAQSLINKSLESVSDADVKILFDKFKTITHELDNLVEISKTKVDSTEESVFKFEVTGEKMVQRTIVKIPKTKFKELEETEGQIKKILKGDRQLNIAVLTKLIQEQLKNEKD